MFLFNKKLKARKVIDGGKTRKIDHCDTELSYQVGNLQKIGKRAAQEDSFALVNALDVNEMMKNGLFAIVADGMGGMKDGKLVSQMAVESFIHEFHNLNRETDISKQLYDSVIRVNQLIYDKFQGDGGTTIVITMIYQGMTYWVSVGDSSIYLKRNGCLSKLNKDHTYQNELFLNEIYKEEINKTDVESNKDGVRLSEFLGNRDISEIDYNIKPFRLRKDDVILLCSDGVSSYLDEKSILAALEYPPETACDYFNIMIDQKQNRNQDNYTALVISCLN